jgi:acyl-CoA synthetase (AMP-forming)/AMP-acid ligase II
MLILQIAGTRAGNIFVPFNWRLAPAEIAALAADAGPEIVFHDPEFAPPSKVKRALPVADMLALGSAGAQPPDSARRPFDAVATLLYTSGTSGRPKGVMLSEENSFWGCANFFYGNDVTMHSVFLCDMPLFHTAGLYAASRVPIQAGGCVLISKGFDPRMTLQRLSDPALEVTHYFSVPQMAATIWNQPDFKPEMLQGLVGWGHRRCAQPQGANTALRECWYQDHRRIWYVRNRFKLRDADARYRDPVQQGGKLRPAVHDHRNPDCRRRRECSSRRPGRRAMAARSLCREWLLESA